MSISLETLPARDCPSAVVASESFPPDVESTPPPETSYDSPWIVGLNDTLPALLPTDAPTDDLVGTSNVVANWPPVRDVVRLPRERPPVALPPAVTPTTGSVVDTPTPALPPGGDTPPPATPPASVSVVPLLPQPGQQLTPDLPAFLISARTAGLSLRVPYTLAAHGTAGTTAVSSLVTLGAHSPQVTVTPRQVFGGSPELLTVVLHEAGGEYSVPRSATLFVVPVEQVRDTVLVEAHREGRSAEAFAALTKRYEPAVTRTVLRIVGNRTDVQDVSQFVFMELARTRARFPGSLSGWLRVVSRNAALAFLRAKRRLRMHEQRAAKGEQMDAEPVIPDDSLAAALGRLPPDLGQAVRLRYLDGYTQQEAAEILGVPRGTLSRRAAAGVRILRELLEWEPHFGEHPGGGRHSGE